MYISQLYTKKITWFVSDVDTEWPSKLQPACLPANIHRKRATNYSPFQLMFGREFDLLPPIRLLNFKEEKVEEENDDEDTE